MSRRRDMEMGAGGREGRCRDLNLQGRTIKVLPTTSFISGNKGKAKSPLLGIGHQNWQRRQGEESVELCPK